MVRSPALTPSGRAPKVSLNRSAVVEIKRQGSKTKTQVLHINFDKKDLATLVLCVETALHKSPSDPPVRLASLSYLPAEEARTGSAGSSTGTGASALDGTPFCPRSKQTKTARHAKKNQYTLLTLENFDPTLFWAMDKVYLEAVVKTEGEEEEEIVNDENNRRLSNGSVATPTTSPAGRGVDTNTRVSGSGRPPRSVSPPSRSHSPANAVSPSSPPYADHRSQMVGSANKRGAGRSRASNGRGDPSMSTPSPARKGPPKEPLGGRGDDGAGVFRELVPSVVGGGASSPAVSALSSRASSIATQGHEGVGGDRGRGVSSDNHDSGVDGDIDSNNPVRKQSGASSITTVAEPGDASSPELASPGPGKLSVLFRRASAASQLPLDSARDSDRDDGETSGAEERVDGGGGGGDGDEGGSIDSSSVGASAGLAGGDGRRAASRRDPVAKQQCPQLQPRGRGGGRDTESTRWGGRREFGSGSASSAGTTCSGSNRGETAGNVGGQQRKVDKSGGTRGEGLGDKRQRAVTKKKELYPASGTTGTTVKSRDPKKRNPTTPSSKKVFTAGGATTATTTSTTVTPRKQQQQRSAWAAKPSERRQPPFKPVGTPKAKLPLRTNSATKMNTKSRSPRPKGAASGDGRSGGGDSGGGGSRVGESDGATPGGGSPSPSKRPPPRVSTSSHMFWERNLRTVSKTPSKKKDNSPSGKKDALRRAMRKAGNGRGGGGWGGTGGEGGRGEDGRPSVGTWTKTQNYLQILKELSGKDDEELQWLAVAKQGKGVEKSEKRQESAETEYHRLLCEESMQQAGLKLMKDRRLEVALKAFGKLGNSLERLTERLEELGEKEMTLITEDEDAEHEASMEVDAAVAKAAAAELEAAEAEAAEGEVSVEGDEDEDQGAAAERAAEAVSAARAAAEAAVAAAEASRASRHAQRGRLEQERGEAEEKLGQLLEDIAAGKEKLGDLGAVLKEECREVPGGGGRALETVVGITADVCSARELIAPARATSGLRSLEGAAKTLAEELNQTRSDSQSALARMEKWRERKEALPEYEKEIADREKAWFEREAPANEEALRRTRALLPVGVTGLTVAELERRAIEAGSLYPRELALRLKENRLLHWTVTHRDDIARSNFLRGDHAHFFTNLDQYDLVELRAVMACLPAKFEVDADGRKAAWRAGFLQRVQGLVAQERGDTVSGGWDPELQARRQVQLPKLTAEQTRRKEYHYPTATEVEQKVDKLQERQRRLEAKQAKLAQVKDELLPEAKEEYANVLEDTRHPANKEAFKPEDLRRARDEAKAEVERLSKELRRLEADAASAKRALRESPYTVESLRAEAEATRRLLTDRARKARILAKQQQQQEQEAKEAKENAAAAAAAAAATGAAEEALPAAVVWGSTEGEAEEAITDGLDGDTVAGEKTDEVAVADEYEEQQEEQEQEQEKEEFEVEEGLEIEGGFDPTPELTSRFADKSSSLRFVTAEEDARMRKEELASVFAVRSKAAAAEEDNEGEEEKPSISLASVREVSEEGSGSTGEEQKGNPPTVDAAAGGAGKEQGITKGRMKAFGAILEKTLSQSMLGRAPPSGSVAAGAAARTGVSGKMRVLMSPTRQKQQQPSETKAPPVLTPPCKPKSKFFRSIRSPAAGSQVDDKGIGGAGGTGRPLVPPPPAPMMGLLSQIRARAGGAAGNASSSSSGSGAGANAGMGGLLAQIRAAKGGGGGGGGGGSGIDAEKGAEDSVLEKEKDSGIIPPPLPQPPAPSLPPRSLFAAAGPSAAAAQGPPPDFFAQLRAKAAEKQALRRAADGETDN